MKPLFPPWADSLVRLALVVLVTTIVVVPTGFIAWARTPYATSQREPLEQPVQFDHRHHVRDDGVDCLYCHSGATRSPYAGVPPSQTCMNCHSQVWRDAEKLAPVRSSYFEGRPLVWNRVDALPDHVYFDHSAHTNRGVGCVECHGHVDRMETPYAAAPLTMGFCLDCHREPANHLRDQDRITDMDWQPPPGSGERILRERHIEPPTHCSGCHR